MMRLSAIPFRTSVLAAALGIAACSGGGGGGALATGKGEGSATGPVAVKSSSDATPEGAYNGTLRDATSQAKMQLVILENGELWGVYGQDDSSTFWIDGFSHGKAVAQARSMRIDDLRDYGNLSPASAPMEARYDGSARTLSGTIAGPDGDLALEAGAVTDGAIYEYRAPANPAKLAGSWPLQSLRHGAGSVSIHADGGLHAAVIGGCEAHGSALPRPSGKNVFDVRMTYGPLCEEPGKQVAGIGVVYPVPGSALQLVIAVTDTEREFGDLLLAGPPPTVQSDAAPEGAAPAPGAPAGAAASAPMNLTPSATAPAPPSLPMSFRPRH
jgi:hypothetical protein